MLWDFLFIMCSRICIDCKIDKPLIEFYASKNNKNGKMAPCKECFKARYKEEIKESAQKQRNKVKEKNKDFKIPTEGSKVCKTCKKDKLFCNFFINRANLDGMDVNCKECNKIKNSKQYNKHSDKRKKHSKEYHVMNADKHKKYVKDNGDKIRKRDRETYIKKKIEDPIFLIKKRPSNLVRYAFKRRGFEKRSKTFDLIGCTWEQLKTHIESQFEPWMNWENYGGPRNLTVDRINEFWDIDHIIPISSAKTEEDIIRLSHYSNFQPLCSAVNRFIKKDKLDFIK